MTFLTVTNPAANRLNLGRLKLDYPAAAARVERGQGEASDPACGGGHVVIQPGMRVRLTQNIDKDRGFVNGNLGTVVKVLRADVFVVRSNSGVLILVHPVRISGHTFVPATYAYATTIRRAQGATLDVVALRFDRKKPQRGYAYVGVSRARRACDVYLLGDIRRTDWLPVGEDPRGNEQLEPGPLSQGLTDPSTSQMEPGTSDMEPSTQDSGGPGTSSMDDESSDEPDLSQADLRKAADIRRAPEDSDERDDCSASEYDETGVANPWAHRLAAADYTADDEGDLFKALAALPATNP